MPELDFIVILHKKSRKRHSRWTILVDEDLPNFEEQFSSLDSNFEIFLRVQIWCVIWSSNGSWPTCIGVLGVA